jgi:hypothetical protein
MQTNFYVICSECHEQHCTDEVEFLDVEEDNVGRDVMYYVCPEKMKETQSLVYKR